MLSYVSTRSVPTMQPTDEKGRVVGKEKREEAFDQHILYLPPIPTNMQLTWTGKLV